MGSLAGVVAITVGLETGSQYCLKQYVTNKNENMLYLGMAGYAATAYFVGRMLENKNMLYVNGLWDASSALTILGLSKIIFHEETTNKDTLGFLLASGALWVLSL